MTSFGTGRAPPAVEMQGVSLLRGGRRVLHDVNLSLEDGEFVALLGGNGAGKTTLLHAILGLVPAVQGHIAVLGARPRRGNPAIGYMPQTRALHAGPRLNGRAFLASMIGGGRWGLPRLDRAERRELDRALDLVDATALADRPLGELSGGERQRLLLAQALIGRPRLILLDEPLIGLDPRHQRAVVALIRRVQQEMRVAVLCSTHDLNAMHDALDRVLYIAAGRAAIGAVDEVITAPVLSRLYGAPIDVVRVRGAIFVVHGDQHAAPVLQERAEHV